MIYLRYLSKIFSRETGESGWLDMKLRVLDPWVRKWVLFDNRSLRWADDEASLASEPNNIIKLEEILMVETDVSNSFGI